MIFLKSTINRIIKSLRLVLLSFFFTVFSSCELDEVAPFLDKSIYNDIETAKAATKGIYAGLTSYNAKERGIYVINGFSGLFTSGKNGQTITNPNASNLFSLKPIYDADSEAMWGAYYSVISRCNGLIENVNIGSSPSNDNLVGHAYFLRAYSYFQLTRLWGDIPLWDKIANQTDLHKAKSSSKDIYNLIVSDAQQAGLLMLDNSGSESLGLGYPLKYASNMLLAKVYMTLATNTDLGDGKTEPEYWQLAYDEAIKVKNSGKYILNIDYGELFTMDGENSQESIFEYQLSESSSNNQMGRNFTPWRFKQGNNAYGWLQVHASVYDSHASQYPSDPRLDGTYLTTYTNQENGQTVNSHPITNRTSFRNSNPPFFKFAVKDVTHSAQFNNMNYIVYRYADLLLMLAEISNELSKDAEAIGYVEEVLNRVGLTPHISYLGGKESFRDAIMREYRFELLGEGEDSHNNRRRGYDYFLSNTILAHNNNPNKSSQYDLTLNTDENKVMKLPIPLEEVTTNNLIDDE